MSYLESDSEAEDQGFISATRSANNSTASADEDNLELAVAFFGYNIHEQPAIQLYGINSNTWYPIMDKPYAHVNLGMAGTSIGTKIYFCDGLHYGPEFQVYDTETDELHVLADLPYERESAGVVALGGFVYLVGGMDNELYDVLDVERYNPREDVWEAVAPLLMPHCEPGIAALDGKLYVVGNYKTTDAYESYCECFDPESNTWMEFAPFPEQMHNTICIVGHLGRLYLVYRNSLNKIYVYDPLSDDWMIKEPDGVIPVVQNIQLIAWGNQLLAADNTCTNYEYDLDLNHWERMTDNPGDMKYVRMAVLTNIRNSDLR